MKQNQQKTKSEGLGDTIAAITHFFYIDNLANIIAKWMGKEDCGCDRRRKKLNRAFPYKK